MKREASSDAEGPPAAKQVRPLPEVTDNHSSDVMGKSSIEVHFIRLCRDFGWTPTELTCAKISDLLGIDTSRTRNFEPALFAFVQHLPFVWDDGALFIGSKTINNKVRTVWYKPTTPGGNVKTNMYLSQRDNSDTESIVKSKSVHTGPAVDRFWPSFTTIFDMSSQKGDHRYIMGVHTILLEFPKLRKSCSYYKIRDWAEGRSTSATDHVPLKKYELPFLPESVWMSKPVGWRSAQDARPVKPPGRPPYHSSRQPSSMTAHRSSIADIERVQSMIQDQRQRCAAYEQQERIQPGSIRQNVLTSDGRFSEPIETTGVAREMAMEAFLNASLEADREPTPLRLMSLNVADHSSQILQNKNFDVSFARPDRTAEAHTQPTVICSARVSQQQLPLQFSLITSVDLPPIVPRRHLILDALCALVMSTDNDNLPQ